MELQASIFENSFLSDKAFALLISISRPSLVLVSMDVIFAIVPTNPSIAGFISKVPAEHVKDVQHYVL